MAGRAPPSLRSRVVNLLKFALPLAALGMLAAVFLISEQPGDTPGLTFTPSDLEAMRSGMKITQPQFSGASSEGDLFNFRAAEVTPRDLELSSAEMRDLYGRVIFATGMIVTLSAVRAELSLADRTVALVEDVRIQTSDGYVASADRVDVDIPAGVLLGEGRVQAQGPLGTISAGSLRIAPADPAAEKPELGKDPLITFGQGVTLRYVPTIDGADE